MTRRISGKMWAVALLGGVAAASLVVAAEHANAFRADTFTQSHPEPGETT